jgi:hypothetical protein
MITATIGRKSFSIPQAWEDLSPDLFKAYCHILSQPLTALEKQAALLKLTVKLAESEWQNIGSEASRDLCNLFSWCVNTLPARIVDSIEVDGINYKFPSTEGFELTSIQYIHIDTAIGEIPEADDDQPIYKLASMSLSDGSKYDTMVAESRLDAMKRLPRWAVWYNSMLCLSAKQYFMTQYDILFSAPAKEEDEQQGDGYGLIGALLSLAETGVFGVYDQVCAQNAHEVFFYLKYRKIQDDAQQEQALKNKLRNGANN